MGNKFEQFLGKLIISCFIGAVVVAAVRVTDQHFKEGIFNGDFIIMVLVYALLDATIFKE